MKLIVIGATGGTGRALLGQALERGHEVTAVVRRPEAVPTAERLRIVRGDVTDAASLAVAFAGHHAVLSALGVVGMRDMMRDTTLYSAGGRNIVRAMEQTGIARLIALTSGGVEKDDPTGAWFYKHILKPLLLQRAYDDMLRFEEALRATSLEWTVVRPTALTDGPRTGVFRVSPRYAPPNGLQISRADLAAFMLDELASRGHLRGTPTLAY